MHVLHLSIFVSREKNGSSIDKEKRKEIGEQTHTHMQRESQQNVLANIASASSHHSVRFCLDEKQQ